MDTKEMILDEITQKQLIWYGHVERMDPTRLPKIMIYWKDISNGKRDMRFGTWKVRSLYRVGLLAAAAARELARCKLDLIG
jgi:hypothetical protein